MSTPPLAFYTSAGGLTAIQVADVPFTNGLTTPLQASVANPALGNATIFVNNSEQLSMTDAVGNTVLFLDSAASHDQNMNNHALTGVSSETFSGGISLAKGVPNSNVSISGIIGGGATSSIAIGGFGSTAQANGANQVIIGSGSAATGGAQYAVNIGNGINSFAFGTVSLGGGNTGITNRQADSVAIGNDQTLAAGGSRGISIGSAAGVGAVSDAIAIGSGAVNAMASSMLVGDAAIANLRPNNNATCDLGTSAAEFKDVWLSNGVRGPLAPASNYSTYADTTCNNTIAETDISTTASSVGSLTLPAGQPLGMVFELNLCATASSAAGDNLDIRFYANAGLLYTHSFTIPALAVNLPITIAARITVRNGAIHVCSISNQNGTLAFVVSSAIVYDRTIAETWSVTAQWGANVNQLTCGQLYTKSYFRG